MKHPTRGGRALIIDVDVISDTAYARHMGDVVAFATRREALDAEKARLEGLLRAREGKSGWQQNSQAIRDKLDGVKAEIELLDA